MAERPPYLCATSSDVNVINGREVRKDFLDGLRIVDVSYTDVQAIHHAACGFQFFLRSCDGENASPKGTRRLCDRESNPLGAADYYDLLFGHHMIEFFRKC